MNVAYAPRAGYTPASCGVVAVGDSSIDLRAKLEDGGGVLVVPDSDTLTQAVLDQHPALKRVKAPEDPPVVTDRLEALSHAQLRDEAKQRGLKAAGSSEELLEAIRAHDNPKEG